MKKFSLKTLSCTLLALVNPALGQDTAKAAKPAPTAVVAQAKAQPTSVAYVRLEKIMSQENLDEAAHEWRDRAQELTKELEPRYKKLGAEREKYEKDVAEFKKSQNSSWMSAQAKEAKAQELYQMGAAWQAEVQQLDAERTQRATALQVDIYNKTQKVTDELREKRGYDIIFYAGGLSVSPRCDLTQDVLAALNSAYTKELAAKEAAKKEKPASSPAAAKAPAKAAEPAKATA